MCVWGKTRRMRVTVPAELSHTGKERTAWKDVDFCISGIVKALNDGGARTIASCCGHGKTDGEIVLADGRTLTVRGRKAARRRKS